MTSVAIGLLLAAVIATRIAGAGDRYRRARWAADLMWPSPVA